MKTDRSSFQQYGYIAVIAIMGLLMALQQCNGGKTVIIPGEGRIDTLIKEVVLWDTFDRIKVVYTDTGSFESSKIPFLPAGTFSPDYVHSPIIDSPFHLGSRIYPIHRPVAIDSQFWVWPDYSEHTGRPIHRNDGGSIWVNPPNDSAYLTIDTVRWVIDNDTIAIMDYEIVSLGPVLSFAPYMEVKRPPAQIREIRQRVRPTIEISPVIGATVFPDRTLFARGLSGSYKQVGASYIRHGSEASSYLLHYKISF